MARKQSLSDLIQEEAQKFTPTGDESAIEVTAEAVTEDTETSVDSSKQTPEPSATKRTNPTKADLEVTIKELQTSLAASQAHEKTLEQQIVELQSALAEQQTSVERLTKELYDTKKTALQLAEANSQLIEESQTLKQEQEALKEATKAAKQEAQVAIQKQPEPKSYKPVLSYRKSHRTPEQMPVQQSEAQDDFSANTWLYD
jgi:chromosome segregation ATPase